MRINDSDLENLIKKTNIEPPAQWQTMALENLKKSVTKENNRGINNSNLNFISQFMTKRKIAVLSLVGVSLLAVTAVATFAIFYLQTPKTTLTSKQILERISMNNPNFTLTQNTIASTAESFNASDAASSKLIAPGLPINSEFNYYYSKTTTTRGPAFNSCNYGIDQSEVLFVPTYESFSYNTDNANYSKYIAYNSDNSVNNYSLSTSNQAQDKYTYQNIIFFGGSYAVRTSGEYSTDVRPLSVSAEPGVEEPMLKNESSLSSSDSVSSNEATTLPAEPINYFGDSAEVLRTETINGKDYYVVQTSYEVNCAGYININRWDNDTAQDNKTMFTLTYANTQDYQILKTETYINSVSSDNLIEATETINQNADIDFESVSSNFNFEFNVPIIDIQIDNSTAVNTYNPDDEVRKTMDYIKAENISVVVPSVSVINQYAYFNYSTKDTFFVQTDSYYTDRNFYPAGTLGDSMFNAYNGIAINYFNTPLALGTVSYSKDDTSYSVNIYSSNDDEKAILNSMLWSDISNKSQTSTNITINGQSITANLYSYEIDQPNILPYMDIMPVDGGSNGCVENCIRKQYVLIFSYGNNKYALTESSFASGSVDSIYDPAVDGNFNGYNPVNEDGLTKINELVTNSVKGTYITDPGVVEPARPL